MDAEPADCFRKFRKLEAERAQVLAELAEWPAGCVSFRPASGAWSAPEVLDHIVLAERGTLADMRLGLEKPHLLGPEARPRIAALDRALHSEERFQVPAGAAAIYPSEETTLQDVTDRWQQARTELQSLTEGLTPADASGGVFHHPFAGWMTFGEVLDHFSAHLYHHRFQLERLRARWAELHA